MNGEKRSQSLKPGEKQRSIDLQQPMLKMTRSTPPIAPARSLMDLTGEQALKHQHHAAPCWLSPFWLACFAESVPAGLGTSAVLQPRAHGIASITCQKYLRGAKSAKAFNMDGVVQRCSRRCVSGGLKAA